MIRPAVSILLTPDPNSNEVLLVVRSTQLRFFGGYFAFPGGTLSEQDKDVSVVHCSDADSPFIAAGARELFEETGIWLARGAAVPEERLREYRRQVISDELTFSKVLKRENHYVDAGDFVPVCRITTPSFSPVRYDTRFFLCRLPEGAQLKIWPGELESGEFMRAKQALERWKQGEMLIAPPVLILLVKLSGDTCQSFLPQVRELTESYERGRLHHVYFSPGVLLAALKTRTRPPAMHTNAYVVGARKLYLIDPGADDPSEQEKLWELLDELLLEERTLEGILLTHHHADHVRAVIPCRDRYGVPIYAHKQTAEHLAEIPFAGFLEHGQELDLGSSPDGRPGWKMRVYHLPGHAPGHLAFQETRYKSVIVGDLVSTVSPILIDPADGHLATYMKSLQFLESVAEGVLYPGHGPPVREGRRAIQQAIAHRRERETQLLQALARGPQDIDLLLEKVYTDIDRNLFPLAKRSLLSGLLKLIEEGRVEESAEGYRLTNRRMP